MKGKDKRPRRQGPTKGENKDDRRQYKDTQNLRNEKHKSPKKESNFFHRFSLLISMEIKVLL